MFRIFNLHFTDYCDFHCKCCFVEKNFRILSLENTKKVVDKIAAYLKKRGIKDGRINIAGGEPMTCSYIQDIIDYIIKNNIRVSIITNGYGLTEEFIIHNKNKIEMIGISIDSINPETNITLGRCRGEKTFPYDRLVKICNCIKEQGIILKINIVVSKININEDIKKLIDDVKPNRFKILQMLPTTDFSKKYAISSEEYHNYLKKYEGYSFVPETFERISNAYVIIDSEGRISTNNLHQETYDILNGDIEDFEDKINFNQENEDSRYENRK